MTKYTILGNKLYKNVKERKDYAPDMIFMNDLPDGARSKVFTNPVTALAYDYDIPSQLDSEYQMDKKDVIKALDFWINDKILENEKLLTLHNKLDDFNEIELKQLIRVKDRVLQMDSDTVFKKFSDDWRNDKYDMFSTETVEFYYEVKKAPEIENRPKIPTISSTETMRNRTISGTVPVWFTPTINFGGDHLNDIIGRYIERIDDDDEISGTLGGGIHSSSSLAGHRITRVDVRGRRTGQPSDHRSIRVQAPNTDPNTWTIHRMGDNPRGWLVREASGRTIANNFITQGSAQRYINERLTNDANSPHFDPNRPITGTTPRLRTEDSHPDYVIGTVSATASSITAQDDGILHIDDTPTNREAIERLGESLNSMVTGVTSSWSTATDSASRAMDDLQGALDQVAEPLRMGDVVVWDRSINRFRRATDDDQQTIRLSTETQNTDFLRWVTTGTVLVPADLHLMPDDMFDLHNDEVNVVMAHGSAAEEIHPGDIIRLDENGHWVKVPDPPTPEPSNTTDEFHPANLLTDLFTDRPGGGPDHILHSNLHPGIPDNDLRFFSGARTGIMHATGPTRSVLSPGAEEGLRTDSNLQPTYMRFENMYVTDMTRRTHGLDLHLRGENNGAEISLSIYDDRIRGRLMDGPHIIQLLSRDNRGRNRIEMDGREYMIGEPVTVTWDRPQGIQTTTTGTPATFEGNDTDFVDYYDMHCSLFDGGIGYSTGENGYVTASFAYSGSLVDINLEVYVTGTEIHQVSSSWGNHTVRIFEHRKDIIEIDGQRIHVLSMDVTFK